METLAERLGSVLAGLGGLGAFYWRAVPALLLPAVTLFLLRNTRPVAFLRRQTDRFLSGLVAVILLVMVFLSGLQIFLRNLFDAGLLWIDPLLRHLVLLLAFVGALIATGLKRHIQINILGRLVRGEWRRVVGATVATISAFVCLALAHASLLLLRDELEFGDMAFLGVPMWGIVLVFPVSFLALAFRFFYLLPLEIAGEAPPPGEEQETAEIDAAGSEEAAA